MWTTRTGGRVPLSFSPTRLSGSDPPPTPDSRGRSSAESRSPFVRFVLPSEAEQRSCDHQPWLPLVQAADQDQPIRRLRLTPSDWKFFFLMIFTAYFLQVDLSKANFTSPHTPLKHTHTHTAVTGSIPPSCCVGGSDVTGRQRQTHVPICRVSRYFSCSSLGKLD